MRPISKLIADQVRHFAISPKGSSHSGSRVWAAESVISVTAARGRPTARIGLTVGLEHAAKLRPLFGLPRLGGQRDQAAKCLADADRVAECAEQLRALQQPSSSALLLTSAHRQQPAIAQNPSEAMLPEPCLPL
jgi:hypothetical protein